MKEQLLMWAYGAIRAAIGGAVNCLAGAFAAPDKFNFTPNGWIAFAHLFVSGFIISLIFYMQKSPLPEWNGNVERRAAPQVPPEVK